jgi:hypothetical protein
VPNLPIATTRAFAAPRLALAIQGSDGPSGTESRVALLVGGSASVRNGVVEHFNDVWDKSFFRTDRFSGLEHLVAENSAFVAFHNEHHRYSAHGGASPDEVWAGSGIAPV